MNRILLGIAACALLVGTTSHANTLSFVDSFDTLPDIAATNADCENFSGSWKGVCKMSDGKSKEEAFTATQKGCETLEVDNGKHKTTLVIGGTFAVSGAVPTTPALTFGMNFNSAWSKDKKTLTVLVGGGKKNLAIDDLGEGGMLREDIQMANAKLTVKLAAHSSKGAFNATCEFDKQ